MSESMLQKTFNVLQMTIGAHFSRFQGYIEILDKGEVLSPTYAEMFKTLLTAAEEEIIEDLDTAKYVAAELSCHRICPRKPDTGQQVSEKTKTKGGDRKD